ncbi:MAG TPA: C10 family peptidase [Bacteroidales bacterium]|nr:C10 family peptidase [Bacteroidales bacterium]
MKKIHIYFSLIGLFLANISLTFAEKIDVKTAQTLATNFYYEKCLLFGYDLKQPEELTLSFTKTKNSEEMYYIFSSQNGYIIVAAEDDAYPVLAYSFEGPYTGKNISPEFGYWMSIYEDQIIHIRKNSMKADKKISDTWNFYLTDFICDEQLKNGTKSVAPLLMSTWDQGTYYNYLCPPDPAGAGGHVYSGCVATAMAQVMYYYRYPVQGTGSHGYYSNYGYLSANFGATTYQWNEMQNNIGGKFNYSMALIQLHCGIAIDMDYSPDGSGASMYDAASAMKSYFGYSASTQLYRKDDYTETQWKNMLIDDLDNKMPIQYAGYGESGHAFVCDGYQGTDFFHFNWGWSGYYNGYFYLNNLNPGYTFSNWQQAILNSYPATAFPQQCSNTTLVQSTCGTVEDGSSPANDYENNKDCMWLIAPTDPVDYIRITFERLNTEAGNDFITIYDGETTSDPVLGVFSGSTIPSDVLSTGNKVLVRFTTNSSVVADGWLLTYNGKITSFCSGVTELTAPSGVISDGSGTYNYNNSTLCHWRISPPDAGTIAITFNNLDLAQDNDFVKIYDDNSDTELMTLHAGDLPPTFTTYTGKVLLLFFTSVMDNAGGWELSYTSSPLSVSENPEAFVSIAPNPASEYVKLQAFLPQATTVDLAICNNLGSVVLSRQLSSTDGRFDEAVDVSDLSQGIYFLKLAADSFQQTQKLIIR